MPLRQSVRNFPIRLALFAVGLTLFACVLNPWHTLLAVLQTAGTFLAGHIFLTLAAAFLLAAIPYKRLGNKLRKPNLPPYSTFLLIFIPLIALSIAIIFLLPSWYVHLTIPGETPEHRLTHEETERKDTGALLLSLFGGYGLYLTWRRAEAGDRTVKTMEQGHITDRYTKAIEQLGKMDGDKPNIEVRLGAIYALERIAWDSPRDHWTIMEVLTAYIRQNSPALPRIDPDEYPEPSRQFDPPEDEIIHPRTEIQAILNVLKRRDPSRDAGRFSLAATDLRGADLRSAKFSRVSLEKANLQGADLRAAELAGANMRQARLQSADLRMANLYGATLHQAQLQNAFLSGANLQASVLSGAGLERANLHGAALEGAQKITVDQIKSATDWEHASYDEEFHKKLFPSDAPSEDPV